ncbi:MAG: helix-turn-helix domain-containing protein, partial [Chloroflexales bacterium]|nr:helix-turn-helix domain-containing protein [Chloroflexales bacterium]
MPAPVAALVPASFTTFGALLRFLRRRARLTQRDLSIAVGYNFAHISRLEQGQRLPNHATVAAVFVPALGLEHAPEWAARLLELADSAHDAALVNALSASADASAQLDLVPA